MVIGSHNAWSYLRPKKWWMRLLRFTARCQKDDIENQYLVHGSRCFDLRVRFKGESIYSVVVAHGLIEYDCRLEELANTLTWLDKQGDCYVRVINEIRREKDYNKEEVLIFARFCALIEGSYKNIHFFCGMNLLPTPTYDYHFKANAPTCEELYASVRPPRLWDDWFPYIYAKRNNHKNITKGTDKDILLIDFVNIQ